MGGFFGKGGGRTGAGISSTGGRTGVGVGGSNHRTGTGISWSDADEKDSLRDTVSAFLGGGAMDLFNRSRAEQGERLDAYRNLRGTPAKPDPRPAPGGTGHRGNRVQHRDPDLGGGWNSPISTGGGMDYRPGMHNDFELPESEGWHDGPGDRWQDEFDEEARDDWDEQPWSTGPGEPVDADGDGEADYTRLPGRTPWQESHLDDLLGGLIGWDFDFGGNPDAGPPAAPPTGPPGDGGKRGSTNINSAHEGRYRRGRRR